MRKIVVLLMIVLMLVPAAGMAKGGQAVVFDDPVLEAALHKAVGIPGGNVTDKDLAKVKALGIGRDYEENPDPAAQVHSIAALVYCTSLQALQLNFQDISDISPLAGLTKLKTLELGGSPITDITPLGKLTSLENLTLFNCQARDYSVLAKLKKLKTLYLDYSTISSLAPLEKLSSLQTLGLKATPVVDVAPLAKLKSLRALYLEGSAVRDHTPIEKIYAKLKEKDFEFTKPTPAPAGTAVFFDDAVLEAAIRQALGKPEGDVYESDLASLEYLGTGRDFEKFPREGSQVKSIETLKHCVNLTGLELHFNQITDITPLTGLVKLAELKLGGNPVADITPLSGLENLENLTLFNCEAGDYSPLAHLTRLKGLQLDFSSIKSLEPLAGLTNLSGLWLSNTPVTDLSPLAGLTGLTTLSLKGCIISDYSPIAGIFPNLREPDFDPERPVTVITFKDPMMEGLIRGRTGVYEGNVTAEQAGLITELGFERFDDRPAQDDIFDLSDLRYCTGLRQLTLNNITATDLSPLSSLTSLEDLKLRGSKANDYSALAALTSLRGLDLTGSAIADLSPLAGLSRLEGLTLCFTEASDLSPLKGLSNLSGLKLEGAPVKDYSPVAALYPNLGKCDFIIPEPGKVRFSDRLLEERVRKAMNRPDGDITPEEAAAVSSMDLSQDESSENSISLLQGLEAFSGLTELNLSGNTQLADLWPISGLVKLEKLNCWKCNILSLKPVSGLTNLRELILGWNGSITSLDALSGLKNLFALDAKGVGIKDISGLAGLPKLVYVGLNGNRITDMSPLASLPSLTQAELAENPTDDYSALADIYPRLEYKDFTLDATVQDQGSDGPAEGEGWQYDPTYRTLSILGDAAMIPYRPDHDDPEAAARTDAPWAGYLAEMEHILVLDAVTHVSDYAFAYAPALKTVAIGKNVTSLGTRCLYRCGNWIDATELTISINCEVMPALGNDVMGYTWDNPNVLLKVPEGQLSKWSTLFGMLKHITAR